MKQSTARIKSVTMKTSGFKLDVLRGSVGPHSSLIDDARKVSDHFKNKMHGFALVAWDKQGYAYASYEYKDGFVVAPKSIPDFVKSKIERAMQNVEPE